MNTDIVCYTNEYLKSEVLHSSRNRKTRYYDALWEWWQTDECHRSNSSPLERYIAGLVQSVIGSVESIFHVVVVFPCKYINRCCCCLPNDVLFIAGLVAYWPAPIHDVALLDLYCPHVTSGRLAVCYSQRRSILSSATAFTTAKRR